MPNPCISQCVFIASLMSIKISMGEYCKTMLVVPLTITGNFLYFFFFLELVYM